MGKLIEREVKIAYVKQIIEKKITARQVAKELNVHEATVYDWVKKYRICVERGNLRLRCKWKKISKTPFLDEDYFIKRRLKLRAVVAAGNGEEMLEPYERETLTYGS